MHCEKCNKQVEKGYVKSLETTNCIYYLCEECMLDLEDKLEEWIK